MEDFGSKLMPNVMLQGLFGFFVEERDIFVKMNQSLRLTARLSPEDPFPPEYVKAFDDPETASMRIISRRRTDPGVDLLSPHVLAYAAGVRLPDIEPFRRLFHFCTGPIE